MTQSDSNDDTRVALRYHEETKHSEERLARSRHFLDWPNRPLPFKLYRDLEPRLLPGDAETLVEGTPPALEALSLPGAEGSEREGSEPSLAQLARVLFLSAGITKRLKRYAGGELYFRAYANTGALYHIDLYLIARELPELEAGVYHFGPHDFSLTRLRAGDYRATLVEASGGHERLRRAPLILASASTYWRNAWKYQARTYRHCFWDAGTLHANLIAIARAEALAPHLILGFADATVTELLALDPAREGALSLVALGRAAQEPPPAPPLTALSLETRALSPSEVDYPLIREMHAASSLATGSAAKVWRGDMPEPDPEARSAIVRELATPRTADLPGASLAEVVRKRGSTRAFDAARAIPFESLSTALANATVGIRADVYGPARETLLELYLIVHAVTGLPSGAYYYRRRDAALELLREGDFRAHAGRLALGQELAAAAAANVYALCSLSEVLGRFGNRGYRASQLEGGIIGGRLYLSAYAQGLGASGLTFLDDEVTDFFSPHAAGKSVMFLTALGYTDRGALRLGA